MNRECLKNSLRRYRWLFIWSVFQVILIAAIMKRGAVPGNTLGVELIAAVVFGYALFVDMSTQVWWDRLQVYWRTLDAFSVRPLRRSILIAELASVTSGFLSMNNAAGKPFDSIVFSGTGGPIHISPGLHRREELEELLQLLYKQRPEAFTDPQVIEFMEGGFTDWWRYR